MRSAILLLLYLLCTSLAADPVPVVPIAYELHDVDYYAQQTEEWKQVATTESCSQIAWYYYFMAANYANLFGHQPAFDLDQLLVEAEKVLAEADYALHYLRCRRAKSTEERFFHLRRANEVDPAEPISYPGLALYHEFEGNYALRDSFMNLVDLHTPYPRGSMDWNYNQLQSVADDGILVTHGDNDTYPSWLLQGKYGVKPGVRIVNLSLLINFPDYRARIFRELSLTEPDIADPAKAGATILEALATGNRPLFIGTGAGNSLVSERADQMYLTGLTFHYTKDYFNNLGTLLANYKTRWRLDELKNPLDSSPRQRVVDQLNQNYLPALLELRGHFERTDLAELARTERLINAIAERSGLGNVIQSYLDPELPQLASEDPGLKAKQIDKKVVRIPGGELFRLSSSKKKHVVISEFYLQTEEVSNADYQLFLEDLLRQRKFDVLDSAAIQPVDFLSLIPDSLRDIPEELLYNRGKPTDGNHPVTNISHAAAKLYANWLTQVYNQDPKRKDGQNVRFRLPTEEEFIYAARGGKDFVPYPWGGPRIRNSNGCYLANFNTLLPHSASGLKEPGPAPTFSGIKRDTSSGPPQMVAMLTGTTCGDGGSLSVPTDAYFPNAYGLYQMSGNAAEMIDEPGKDMGGSWLDHSYYMQIGVVQERTIPHPAVGFRLVMEVVKE